MGLETASFISELDSANPPGADAKNQGDDHLRLIKAVLKSQFSGFAGATAITVSEVEVNRLAGITDTILNLLLLKLDVADVVAGVGEVPRNDEGLMTLLHADIWDGANLIVSTVAPTTEGVDGDIYLEREV